MARLFFASFVTIGLLLGMVCGVVLAALVFTDSVNLALAITITIVINGVIWLVSPWITDLSLRWFNKLVFLDDAEVQVALSGVHALVHEVADQYGFSAPRLGTYPRPQPDRLHLRPAALQRAHRRHRRHLRVSQRGRAARPSSRTSSATSSTATSSS